MTCGDVRSVLGARAVSRPSSDTPASSRTSGMVGQFTLKRASGDGLVINTGPPALPAGSMVPDIDISRLGWVGPMTEQW